MFFDQDALNVRILDVLELNQENSDTLNRRGYHALSFRVEADTHLSFSDRTIYAGNGTIGYFPANLSYRRQSLRDKMIVIHFDIMDYHSGNIEIISMEDSSQVHSLFQEALTAWKQRQPGYYFRAASCFYEIMALLRRERARQSPQKLPALIQSAVSYLDSHFSKPSLSIADVAKASGVSEAHFRRLFREAVGQSPRQYLIGKRISHAISLLDSGVLTVQQVSEQSGFSDPKYFSTVFKQVVGCSPSAYLYHWDITDAVSQTT